MIAYPSNTRFALKICHFGRRSRRMSRPENRRVDQLQTPALITLRVESADRA